MQGRSADIKVTEVAKFLKSHLDQGRQAYIVYPLIDESEPAGPADVSLPPSLTDPADASLAALALLSPLSLEDSLSRVLSSPHADAIRVSAPRSPSAPRQ